MKMRGFTLIELLVVFSIVAMLSSIVLASLATAKNKAILSAKMQSIDQIVLAMQLYYQDNADFPPLPSGGPLAPVESLRAKLVPKYISSVDNKNDTIIGYWHVCSVTTPCESGHQKQSDLLFPICDNSNPKSPKATAMIWVNFMGPNPPYATYAGVNHYRCVYPI